MHLRSSKGRDRQVSRTWIRQREWLLPIFIGAPPLSLTKGCLQTQLRKKNLAETPRLGPEVQTKVKNKPNGRRKLPFHAPKTPKKVMVGSVGFEPTTSRAPGLYGTSQAAKRRPGKPDALHDASRRLAHDPVARSEHTISIKRVLIDRLALLQKCGPA